MAAARLAASLGGAAEQRAAAYTELTALAHGDAPDATTGLATATLHVGGLAGEMEDEMLLAELFSKWGRVLAVTLRRRRKRKKVSWALVSYASDAEAQRVLVEHRIEGVVIKPADMDQVLKSTGEMAATMRQHKGRVAEQAGVRSPYRHAGC